MLRSAAAILVVAVFATACANKGGGRDGETHGDLMPSGGGDAGNLLVMAAVSAVSAPLEVINLTKDWERIQQDEPMPWVAPGKRVEAYAKDRIPTGWDLNSEKYRWKVGDELIYPFHKYHPRINKYIVKDPISKNWEFDDERYNRKLMPDYEFYLASIEPMAVIMVSTGIHRRAKWLPAKRQKLTDYGDIPDTSIRWATSFAAPKGRAILWFSPDLKVAPQPVTFDDTGAFTAKFLKSQMTCTRTGETVDCQRSAL